jgi:hypothetical protein
LLEPHVTPFQMTGRGAMKGWVVVDREGVADDDELKVWLQRATKFVALPAK